MAFYFMRIHAKINHALRQIKQILLSVFRQSDKIPLAPVQIGNKWGYIDKNGKRVIKPQFEDAQWFQEGLARIKLGGKWGYISKSRKMVSNPQPQIPPAQEKQTVPLTPELEAKKKEYEDKLAATQKELAEENAKEKPDRIRVKSLTNKIKIINDSLNNLGKKAPIVQQPLQQEHEAPPVEEEEEETSNNGNFVEGKEIDPSQIHLSRQQGLSPEDEELRDNTLAVLNKLKTMLRLKGDTMPSFDSYIKYMKTQYVRKYGKATGGAKMEEFFWRFYSCL